MAINTERELAWWVDFGQIDFDNYKEKAIRYLWSDFVHKVRLYEEDGMPFHQDSILSCEEEYFPCKAYVEKFVDSVKKVLRSGEDHHNFVSKETLEVRFSVGYTDGEFHTLPHPNNDPLYVVALIFNRMLDGARKENFYDCQFDDCDNIFYQYSKHRKKFCSKRCATLAGHARHK